MTSLIKDQYLRYCPPDVGAILAISARLTTTEKKQDTVTMKQTKSPAKPPFAKPTESETKMNSQDAM
jgi:hypothetical protein